MPTTSVYYKDRDLVVTYNYTSAEYEPRYDIDRDAFAEVVKVMFDGRDVTNLLRNHIANISEQILFNR